MQISQLPSGDVIGWVDEEFPRVNRYLEVVKEEEYIDELNLPTYVYLTVSVRGHMIRLGVDTGSARTLMAEEIYIMVNADHQYPIQTQNTSFEAVNGTKIECLGFVKMPVLFYGMEKNYEATIRFFIIRGLGLQGLLGLDEITRHQFNINPADGTCFQIKAGQIFINTMYRENRGIRRVSIAKDVILPPSSECDIEVNIEGLTPNKMGGV